MLLRVSRLLWERGGMSHLDGLGGLEGLLGGNADLALAEQLLDEVGDVASGDRDVLDAAADHVALRLATHTHTEVQLPIT